jgi:hypothetical protein
MDGPDRLEEVLDKASEVYTWFSMLQLAGFEKGEAFVLLPPLIVGGYVVRRD